MYDSDLRGKIRISAEIKSYQNTVGKSIQISSIFMTSETLVRLRGTYVLLFPIKPITSTPFITLVGADQSHIYIYCCNLVGIPLRNDHHNPYYDP